jgi:hypothetical protein
MERCFGGVCLLVNDMKDLYAYCYRRAETISINEWMVTLEDETSQHLRYFCIEADPLQVWHPLW